MRTLSSVGAVLFVDYRRSLGVELVISLFSVRLRAFGDKSRIIAVTLRSAEFIKDNTILTIGMEDENPAFESVRIGTGLQYNLLQPVDKVVFGIAWATDYEGADDVRTWYAADPTLD